VLTFTYGGNHAIALRGASHPTNSPYCPLPLCIIPLASDKYPKTSAACILGDFCPCVTLSRSSPRSPPEKTKTETKMSAACSSQSLLCPSTPAAHTKFSCQHSLLPDQANGPCQPEPVPSRTRTASHVSSPRLNHPKGYPCRQKAAALNVRNRQESVGVKSVEQPRRRIRALRTVDPDGRTR
jgi:hypothetical protein